MQLPSAPVAETPEQHHDLNHAFIPLNLRARVAARMCGVGIRTQRVFELAMMLDAATDDRRRSTDPYFGSLRDHILSFGEPCNALTTHAVPSSDEM
jgi:hypothetical protein